VENKDLKSFPFKYDDKVTKKIESPNKNKKSPKSNAIPEDSIEIRTDLEETPKKSAGPVVQKSLGKSDDYSDDFN